MLAAVNVIPESSNDFPDGSMRFNLCNCQPAAAKGMGSLAVNAPLFDFSFWNSAFRGGGGSTATPTPEPAAALPSFPAFDLKTIAVVGLTAAAVLWAMKGKR